MKILHTSDWHVGRTLARRSRLDEAREVLTEIVDIAERESVDAVLVCGDVFDHIAPSAAAEGDRLRYPGGIRWNAGRFQSSARPRESRSCATVEGTWSLCLRRFIDPRRAGSAKAGRWRYCPHRGP